MQGLPDVSVARRKHLTQSFELKVCDSIGGECAIILILSNRRRLCMRCISVQCERVESVSVGGCTFGPEQTGSANAIVWNTCRSILQIDGLFFCCAAWVLVCWLRLTHAVMIPASAQSLRY